jgi:peptidoglycan/xylan/chitin deacetylase (PgdA/CDA1 family)
MIGVIADGADEAVVREFFELFKTAWEFYRRDREYEVLLLCAGEAHFDEPAKLRVIYGGRRLDSDEDRKSERRGQQSRPSIVCYRGNQFPLYGDTVTFDRHEGGLLTDDAGGNVAYVERFGQRVHARIGYDLFGEVRTLLTVGQPAAYAKMPALELHIAFLRDLITGSGATLAEIPPVPEGYQFIACLTHDVDHPSIRRHKWDHTVFGFAHRATLGSLRDLVQGRLSFGGALRNWTAVLRLPFVYLGLAKDFWLDFDRRYAELEKSLPSTFFAIPFANRPGQGAHGPAPSFRGSRYGACDIADTLKSLVAGGCEVGLHGIDAWRDSSAGQEELEEIRRWTGHSEVGVRMHWLYYDRESAALLEEAGAAYDSTIGYNETVGYRAGTTQVYKLPGTSGLLELPLHVMDTALFYPAYLGLSRRQASALLHRMADNAARFGGCITVNWHDRSTAPERLWGGCYGDLVQALKDRGAWFATAGEAVSWFRKRRSAEFPSSCTGPGEGHVRPATGESDGLPGLQLRIHQGRETVCVDTALGAGADAHNSCQGTEVA